MLVFDSNIYISQNNLSFPYVVIFPKLAVIFLAFNFECPLVPISILLFYKLKMDSGNNLSKFELEDDNFSGLYRYWTFTKSVIKTVDLITIVDRLGAVTWGNNIHSTALLNRFTGIKHSH